MHCEIYTLFNERIYHGTALVLSLTYFRPALAYWWQPIQRFAVMIPIIKQAWQTSWSHHAGQPLMHSAPNEAAPVVLSLEKIQRPNIMHEAHLETKHLSNRPVNRGRSKVNANRLALGNRRNPRIAAARSPLSQQEAMVTAPRAEDFGRVPLIEFQRSLVKESLGNYSIREAVDLLNAWDQEDQEFLLSTFDNRTRMVLRYKLQNMIVTLDNEAKQFRREKFIQRLQHQRSTP